MEKYKLKDCCKFIDYRGKTPEKSDAGYRLITAKNVKPSGYCDEPKEYIPIESYESVMVRGIPKAGDILFTTEAPLGNIGRIPEFTEPFAVGQRIIVIQPKVELLDQQYMVYKLRSPSFQEEMFRRSSGSTVKGIRSKELVEIEIDFPELREQKRISKILFALERIIEARKNELEQLDNLIKARFVELFGDPVTNPYEWEKHRFDSLCKNLDARRKPITASEREEGIYPYYGASGVVDHVADYLFDEDLLLISEDGANLLMRSTPIAFSVSGKVWVNNHAHVVCFEKMSMQKYIEVYFSMIDISEQITGSAQPKLNQAKLNAMMFAVPDETRLEEFLLFINQIDKSKFQKI